MIGEVLRREREQQNLSIEDILQKTKIQSRYIEYIESGKYDKIPSLVYTRGFIKKYAQVLNLDVDAILTELDKELNNDSKNDVEVHVHYDSPHEELAENIETPFQPPEQKHLSSSSRSKPKRSFKRLLLGVGLIFVIVVYCLTFQSFDKDSSSMASQNTQQSTPNLQQTLDVPQQIPSANEKIVIQAYFNAPCWILVSVDGEVVREGTIEEGQALSWEGDNQIIVKLGNAGAVEFSQNDKPLGILGKDGEVIEKIFTKN